MVNAKLVSIFFSFVGIIGTGMIQSSPDLTDNLQRSLYSPSAKYMFSGGCQLFF